MAGELDRLQAVLGEVSAERAWQHMEWMSREVPERISGWPAARRQADYLSDELRAYGFDTHQDEFLGLVSYPRRGRLEVLAPESLTLAAMTFAHSTSTPPAGLEGELIYLGAGGEADYEGHDARGKIVVAELSYSPPRPEKTRIATRHGAIGLVLLNWGLDDNPSIPMGTVKSVWGNPTVDTLADMPNLPAIGVARTEGVKVRDLIQSGVAVRARIVADADREWRRLHQPHGSLGVGAPDWLLIADHMDSWGGGATDNTSGNAVTLEVARVLAAHRDELRREVQIAFWQAHENGIMEGSTWFVDRYWDEIAQGMIGYLNIDSPGMKFAGEYEATVSPELWSWHCELMQAALGYVSEPHRLAKTGDQSFFGAGIPAISGRSSFSKEQLDAWHGAVLGPWYQSADDTMAVADKGVLAQDLKMTMAYAWSLATRPVLPYDFRTSARIAREALDGYRAATDGTLDLDETLQRAHELEEATAPLYDRAQELEQRCEGDDGSAELEAAAGVLNQGLKELSRLVVPLLTSVVGRYGQDSYGLSALRQWIPSLAGVGELKQYAPDSGEHMLLWGKLMRERNRVTDTLQRASTVARALTEEAR